jgi:alginate O-acetyltransferase complex protein AlgI
MDVLSLFAHDPRSPLLFNSGAFFLLFTVFVAVHAALRGRNRARLGWLLAFSLYYYYRSNGAYTLVLVALATVDFGIALRLHAEERPARRKAWLATSVTLNLLGLGFFKYTNFALGNLALLAGRRFEPFHIFLPLGISFHVFQSISYLVDVYRRRYAPVRSLAEYVAFLCFFPQIVAGPIVRAPEFFGQIHPLADPPPDEVAAGLFRILQGVAKKALLADYLGRYADLVFGAPSTYSGPEALLAAYAYALQIYLDFSGYSDIALGMARILGVRIPENFSAPYRAASITDFWRRWHISLSSWLREYLYVPLGGNRHGRARQVAALMITMLLGGLWHGASWTFVVWGGLHGAALVADKVVQDRFGRPRSRAGRALGWVLTLHLVTGLWVIFRARTLAGAGAVFASLLHGWDPARIATLAGARRALVAAVVAGFLLGVTPGASWERLEARFRVLPTFAKVCAFAFLVQAVLQVSTSDVQPFIYFQF